MDLNLLHSFVTVAEELHFGRAADALHLSQPPLSRRIRRLEEEMGVALFLRNRRRVSLTPAGRLFLERAREILAMTERAVAEARDAAMGRIGRLGLGYMGPALDGPLPEALGRFRAVWPKVDLRLVEAGSPEQGAMILRGELDAGCVRLFGPLPLGLVAEVFQEEPYVLAAPPDHPLADTEPVPLRALHGAPLIFFPRRRHAGLHDAVLEGLRRAGAEPVIVQEAGTKAAILALVSAGMGVGLAPASMRSRLQPGVRFMELEPGLPLVTIGLLRRDEPLLPPLESFLDILRHCARRWRSGIAPKEKGGDNREAEARSGFFPEG